MYISKIKTISTLKLKNKMFLHFYLDRSKILFSLSIKKKSESCNTTYIPMIKTPSFCNENYYNNLNLFRFSDFAPKIAEILYFHMCPCPYQNYIFSPMNFWTPCYLGL
jgi:hypothetical protein